MGVLRMRLNIWRMLTGLLLLSTLLLSGCIFSSESQQARETADKFWQAILNEDMDKAKDLTTWDSAQYLQYLSSKSVSAQRFETGEIKVQDNTAEVATVLYGGEKGDMVIPLRTVLVRNKDEWQVDVQKTMGSMVSGAMGAVADQLNSFMQDGLRDLDKALSDSVSELNKSLKKGVEQLQQELTEPPTEAPPSSPNEVPPEGKAI